MRGPTVGGLLSSGEIRPADLSAAVDAFLANPDPGLVLIGEYEVDVAAAVAARPHAVKVLQAARSGVAARRAAVRTAILLAQPRRR